MTDKTVLVVVDPTAPPEQPVIARAAWLAPRVSASLELCIVDYDAELDPGDAMEESLRRGRDRLVERHRATLESIADGLRRRGLTVTTDVVWDHPLGEALVRKIAAGEPWLVAKDTHYHSVPKRTIFSNTDWELIRACPAPLLLVKPRTLAARPKVLAAVDPLHEHDKPGHLDDAIFGLAASLAEAVGGELHVVHAFSPPMGLELPPDAARLIAAQHREALASFVATHPVPKERAHLLAASPTESLPAFAEEEAADFVVMGAVSRRGLSRWFIGSTAEQILDRLPCDLVIVKPPPKA
ncbi:MAG TPA: universal stress protein [Gammaproteobacteria bacterium]